ncbi:MAG TPA: DUF4412 domain-containing protein [Taishania sp.]|nr:DUF4412 domain-containing protein [Taishania sp.]
MKKLLTLFLGLTVAVGSFAQTTEGVVKYTTEFKSSDPQIQSQLAMLNGSTMTTYFTPEFTRVESNMGMFMKTSTIIDLKSKQSLMLMDGMGSKKAIKTNLDELDKEDGEEAKVEVEKTSKTKKIAGYKCTQYILTTEDGTTMNYWTTTELSGSKAGNKFMNEKVEGYPLEFELANNGVVMKFTATEVAKGIKEDKAKLFNMDIPEGFQEASMDDLKNMGM